MQDIAQAKQAYYKKINRFITSNTVSLDTRKSLIKSFMQNIVLNGAETWTILKAQVAEIKDFEVCCWRRTLGIPWIEKVKNVEVFKKLNGYSKINMEYVEVEKKRISSRVLNKVQSLDNRNNRVENRRQTEKGKAQNTIFEASYGRYRTYKELKINIGGRKN